MTEPFAGDLPFPEPTGPRSSQAEVLLEYLDYFRSVLAGKLQDLPEAELRGSRLPSGWAPIELLKHLRYVELRWLWWGFEGHDIAGPWGDSREGRWYVGPDETLEHLLSELRQQAAVTREVAGRHDLTEQGQPGDRWDGAEPASLGRILLHLVQEYARHVGHLDIVRELIDGTVGE